MHWRSGQETANDYATTAGVPWSSYAKAKAKAQAIPSIVASSMYADAEAYFKQAGVTTTGFIRWSRND